MAPSKPTKADIERMKTELQAVRSLKTRMANDSRLTSLDGTIDIQSAIGNLIDGQGMQLSGYYMTIAQAVRSQTQATVHALDTVATLLDGSIKNYEAHEKNVKGAADGTGNGGSSGGEGRG